MRDDSRELACNYTQDSAALRDVYAPQTLGAECKRDIVADRVEVVLAVGPRDDLIVLAVLSDLLEAAVEIADVRDAPNDRLALELENQAKHAVGCGVLRAQVDQHMICRELGLERWRRGNGEIASVAA